ncbi:MAG: RNA 2',3'-cyclic phosphodiesterase, partial [Candidatus Eiseniibacteriota bacterium]
ELDGDPLARAEDVVRSVARSATPFTVVLERLGCFPDRGRPRVFWVGLGDGAPRLAELATALAEGFAAAGLGREARPFRPHLTIGRLRQPDRRRRGRRPQPPPKPPQAVAAIQAALAAVACGPLDLPVGALAVVESQLRPGGPVYRDRLVAPLANHVADGT